MDFHGHPDADSDLHPDTVVDINFHLNAYPDGYFIADPYGHEHPYAIVHSDPFLHFYLHPSAFYLDANPVGNGDKHALADEVSNGVVDAHPLAKPHLDAHVHPDRHRHLHLDRGLYGNVDLYDHSHLHLHSHGDHRFHMDPDPVFNS